jgi:predicted RNA-binding Zn ribbon-like protein
MTRQVGRAATPTPIERLTFVGGALCLDFVNTTGNRAGPAPRERLHTLADAATFGRRAGLLDAREARELARAAPGEAAAALAELLALREALYRILRAALEGRAPPRDDLAALNREYRAASARRALAWSPKAPSWRLAAEGGGQRSIADAVVLSAVELLCSADLERLAKCGECDWLFLDTSKNHSRRWCKKTCGDRVKARAYYRRKKAQGV